MKSTDTTRLRVSILLAATFLPPLAFAAQTGDSALVTFQGTFSLPTPCTINDDKVLDIAFGNVGVNKVNGIDYAQPIPLSVDCHGAPESALLLLKVNGTAESFDSAAVATNADGLGIQIQANGQPMKLNEALNTSVGGLKTLALTAVPVKDPAKTLTAQTFSAAATLTADYQ
ncbi:fimbrial protein [Siccibacter colletis]|uniref:fimbrial protein n=1 Tax=Siccibacter colletis TaxID=1505757 RepID=UPI0028BE5008|nr:fimbrial protein [Siccibacter colletis]WNN49338.1 fimbrial protein [Siccibacter colletis]